MNRNPGKDALSIPVHDPWSYPARPTGAMAWSATARVISHRIERELFGFLPVG